MFTKGALFIVTFFSFGLTFVHAHTYRATPNVSLTRNAFGAIETLSNEVSFTEYALNEHSIVTGEVTRIGNETYVLSLTRDRYNRPVCVDGNYLTYHNGKILTISNDEAFVTYHHKRGIGDAGYEIIFADGSRFKRVVSRDAYRPFLVTAITNFSNEAIVGDGLVYHYDALNHPRVRNSDSFNYNSRGEIVYAAIASNLFTYAYDGIGNRLHSTCNGVTNFYAANKLSQYSRMTIGTDVVDFFHDVDGRLCAFSEYALEYDAGGRLVSVATNGVRIAMFFYDAQSRRVKKATQSAVHTYFYDAWNLIEERVHHADGVRDVVKYVWGKDFSGELQKAGGVGGLLYMKHNGTIYIPCYDANGNITDYLNLQGGVVASYVYDPFGGLMWQSGSLADLFPLRFSMKYYDKETAFYYYGLRYYLPKFGRWLSRDPIGEKGGLNLYAFCANNPVSNFDLLGAYTLADARRSLVEKGVQKLERGLFGLKYSDAQIFDEWLRLERMRGEWWKNLPKCPRQISFQNGVPQNPDPSIWSLDNSLKNRIALKIFHGGATMDLRTKGSHKSHPRGNQCVYDKCGKLITEIPSAGTADYYSPNSIFAYPNHITHDVVPFNLASELGRESDYYSVRPSWNE